MNERTFIVRYLIGMAVVGICLGASYRAQASPPDHGREADVLTMSRAIDMAYQNAPAILEAHQRLKAAEARYRQSRKWENPEFEMEVVKVPHDLGGEVTLNEETVEGEVRLTQPFKTFGKRRLVIEMAQEEKRQAELSLKRLRLEVRRQVKERYVQALLFQKGIDLAQDNLERAQRFLDQVSMKYNAGKARNYEIARARLVVAKAKNDLLAAKKRFSVAVRELFILTGQNTRHRIRLKEEWGLSDLSGDFEDYLQEALRNRMEIQSQEREIIKREKAVILSRRRRLPDVNVGMFISREEALYDLGAGVSFEVPIWNTFDEEVKEAVIEKETAELSLSVLKREIELEVYRAFEDVRLSRQAVKNLKDAIKEANELLRITTIEYQEGEVSFLVYLEGLTSYKETKQEYLSALAKYAVDMAVLEQAVGKTAALNGGRQE